MKLDSRIVEGKKPLDCFDTKNYREAMQFIGKKGFFGANKSQFMDLNTCPKRVLDDLKEFDNCDKSPFITSCNHCYRFFLPEEWVKELEKNYRIYSLAEWIAQHEIGEIISYRSKSTRLVFRHVYTGYAYSMDADINKPNKGTLTLGVASYSLDYLFEDYEIEVNGEWKPFGVEE